MWSKQNSITKSKHAYKLNTGAYLYNQKKIPLGHVRKKKE